MPTRPEIPAALSLAGQAVPFTLHRSSRRTIGLMIDHRGLSVRAPLRAPWPAIETLIRQHAEWVLTKLADWQTRTECGPQIAPGTVLSVAGSPYTVVHATGLRRAFRWDSSALQLHLNPDYAPGQALRQALRAVARPYLTQRLAHFSPRLGVVSPPLRLSTARTRWGSCSARGGISLNLRLMLLPPAVIDYVVCHELAHLKEMNHGPRFWSLVSTLCPDWRAQRLALRQLGAQLPFL